MTSHKHEMCHDRVVEAEKNEKVKKLNMILLNVQGDFYGFLDAVDCVKPLLKNKKE